MTRRDPYRPSWRALLPNAVRGAIVALLLVALALAINAYLSPAHGQGVCGDRDVLRETLKKRHDETPRHRGLSANGNVIEILTNDDGSWSLIVITPSGRTCLSAAGEAWEELPKPPLGDPS